REVDIRSAPRGGRDAGAVGGDVRSHTSGGRRLGGGDAHVEADATALEVQGGVERRAGAGTVRAEGQVRALEAHVEATAGATLTTHGLDATADARASIVLVDATGRVSYATPPATVAGVPWNGEVDATVHATVSADAHATGEL